MEKLLKLLDDIRPDVNFEEETALMSDGVLDSFDIVSIISELADEYGVHVRVDDLKPENFDSCHKIMDLILRLKSATE